MIEFQNVGKTFSNGITPFSGVNLTINDGEIVSIIGPSGTGKSTLLRCINLLDPPTEGNIYVDGECITAPGYDAGRVRRKIGMVFQSFNLFSNITVIENIMKPQMDKLGRTKQEAYDKAVELLKTVGLFGWRFSYPNELSGGQKQRIAIARTLAMDPEAILFDEPTSALDPTMVEEVQTIIKRLAGTVKTMMIVTHDMNFVRQISTRVLYLDEGGVYEDGTPEQIFDHPQREKTLAFTKRLKAIRLIIDSPHYDFAAMTARIDEYCRDRRLSIAVSNRVLSLFEELCNEILIPVLGNDMKIRTEIAHIEADNLLTMEFRYTGALFAPKDTENAVSYVIVKNNAASIMHEALDGTDGYTNRVFVTVRM